jgi:hypothetical protein
MKDRRQLKIHSLNSIERMYQQGYIEREDLRWYLREWNAGAHFSQAVFVDGAVRLYDPDNEPIMYSKALRLEFGAR